MSPSASLLAAILLAGATPPASQPSAPGGDWQNVQMVSFARVDDLPALAKLGVNVVLVNVTHDPAVWQSYYQAAVRNGLRLAPLLWAVHQTAWLWNQANGEWELSAKKYPAAVGAKFLAFLRDNPKYLQATFALYAFHEPHNPETPRGLVSADRQRKFWRQIHEQEFPGRSLSLYGESVSWHRDTRNGCVDYDGWSLLYPFVSISGRAMYRPCHWAVGKGLGGVQQWPGPPTTQPESVMENHRRVIDSLHALIAQAPPAPDGTRTRLIPLVQTYAIASRADLWNRMPTAAEMRLWGLQVVGRRTGKLAGLNWYCYRKAANFYTHCLADDPRDPSGEDRLAAIRHVADALRPPAATSQPDR